MNDQEFEKKINELFVGCDMSLGDEFMSVKMTLCDWLSVHGNLLLALSDPQNVGPGAEAAKKVATALGLALVETKFISQEALDFVLKNSGVSLPSRPS